MNRKDALLHVLVPGLGGSQFEAKLNKTSGSLGCKKQSDWYLLWVNITEMIFALRCVIENMK